MNTLEDDKKNEKEPIVYTRRKKQDSNQFNLEQDETFRNQRLSNITSGSTWSTSTPLPSKYRLECILHELQGMDKVIGHPMHLNQVPGYYDIVKEAIDYDTITTKLRENKYHTLEEFEKDVMLVIDNVETYNAITDICYFRQVRSLRLKAKKLFQNLRNNPEETENIGSVERKRPGRKPRAVSGSCSRPGSSSARRRGNKDSDDEGNEDIAAGESSDRRWTYMPSISLFCENDRNPKQFQLVDTCNNYGESLKKFAEEMGPIVQKVVDKKMDPSSLAQAPVHSIYQAPVEFSSNRGRVPYDFNRSSACGQRLVLGGTEGVRNGSSGRMAASEIRSGTPCLVPGNEFVATQQTVRVKTESDEELQMTLMNSYAQYWQNQFRVDTFLQQQTSPAWPSLPLHGNMLGAGNFNAGASSSVANQQTRATTAWNDGKQEQQQPLASDGCLNLELHLGTKPPPSDGAR